MNAVDTRTLLLSQGYEPIKVISWRRAIALISLGKVEVIEEYDAEIRAVSLVIKVPAVVRLLRSFRRHAKPVKFSRANIYARDNHRCQYCGVKCPLHELTYDHVVPRSKGGRTSWENITTCCYACNARKANRTPAEAHMRLRSQPVRPQWIAAVSIRVSTRSVPQAWRDYLYWTGEIESESDAASNGSAGEAQVA
jgi:5-methylcytosine-specific restriction endonuclease McrA